jgi:DNA-binding LacI/PurR family transcriptional regulator
LLNEKFTAFFVVHQEMALRASAALRELGVRCPEDVSLITYEVDDVSEFLNPPHTTLDFNYEQLAHIAIQELSDLIKGIPKKFRVSFNVPNILRKRGTTGPFPGE